jgi:signal transduction histidine kinase
MPEKQLKTKIIVVTVMAVFITLLHYITKMQQVYYHIFYRELYFLPLILSGFWFGLRGGVITSLSISALYLPFIMINWEGFSPEDFDKILEILLFNIVAIGLGFISDRRKAEEKARMQAEHTAREQAESVSRLKSGFLSVVSHELRTPLVSIIGYNDLLLDGVAGIVNEEQIDAMKKIDKNSKRLLDLINAILDFSRLEAQSVQVEEVNLSALIEKVQSETRDLCEQSSLDFVWKVETGLPTLQTDPTRLKVVLKNLISNAVKFTEQGSVTVDIHRHEDGVEIDVADTGVGISPEARQFIFEPFRQVESPLTRRHGGVGIGLYIAKRLLNLMGGTVTVESELGRGSTFHVRIPASNP